MPTVPRAKDSGIFLGHSADSCSNPFPSEMECVVQPDEVSTTVPVGKAEFLLSTTLKDKAHYDICHLFPIIRVKDDV
jgi:hypothetical protein